MRKTELLQYWNYYLLLEKRFIETIDYVELNTSNFPTVSNNYALLMQAIGAEMDTVFKLYCGFNPSVRKTIADYVRFVEDEENDPAASHKFRDQEIYIEEYGIVIQPFKDWDSSRPAQSLPWWDAFDKLKHNRYDNRSLANQENALNMLGALYLLEMKCLKKITEGTEELDIFGERSKLFTLREWSRKAASEMDPIGYLAERLEKGKGYIPDPVDV